MAKIIYQPPTGDPVVVNDSIMPEAAQKMIRNGTLLD